MPEKIDKGQEKKKSSGITIQKRPVMLNQVSTEKNNIIPLKFTSQNLVEALIYSEILGEPKCKKRGRCR
jgi:hypothetical protein